MSVVATVIVGRAVSKRERLVAGPERPRWPGILVADEFSLAARDPVVSVSTAVVLMLPGWRPA